MLRFSNKPVVDQLKPSMLYSKLPAPVAVISSEPLFTSHSEGLDAVTSVITGAVGSTNAIGLPVPAVYSTAQVPSSFLIQTA